MDSLDFKFESEQQRKIHEGLLLFGDGPAAFFKDACRLVSEPVPYKSTTHLVGHLLREIRSAVEYVLQPPTNDPSTGAADPAGARMLQYLGFDETDFVFVFWKRLQRDPGVGLHGMAHRHQLSLRTRNETFDQFWEQVQDCFEQLLDKAKDRLLDIARRIEELASKDTPTAEDIVTLSNRFPHHPVFLRRFFAKLESPNWLDPLEQAGYFTAPPSRIERDGTLRFQSWPQSRFLARVADKAPERVRDVILKVPLSDNDPVVSDFAEAALAMPPNVAEPVVEKIVEWINDREQLYLVEPVAKNISHLADGGLEDSAFELATALLHVVPVGDLSENTLDQSPALRVDKYLFHAVLQEQITPLGLRHPRRTLLLLCSLLNSALPSTDSALGGEWDVFHYRPTIAGDIEHGELMFANVLIDAIRDILEHSANAQDSTAQACSILDSYSREVFRRLKLYTLERASDPPLPHIRAALLDLDDFDNSRIWPEFEGLLHKHYASLRSTEQTSILSWIARGPQGLWPEAKDPDREKKVRYWKFKKLQPIQADLTSAWQAEYTELSAEFEKRDHEEERLRELSGGWEVSPIEKDEFAKKQVEEIVSYITTWAPDTSSHPRAGRRSLLRTFEDLVAEEPDRFMGHVDVLGTLDTDARSYVFSGLSKALSQDRDFNWTNTLQLCQSSLDLHSSGQDSESTKQVRWMRQVIAQLVTAGLESSTHPIPHEHAEDVLQLVKHLVRDLDPEPDREMSHDSIGGAWGLAINSVRGYAVAAFFEYANWLRRPAGVSQDQSPLPDELWEFIESYLADRSCWNRTTHVVLGRFLPEVLRSDERRTIALFPALFPEDEHAIHLFDAAWEGFIMHWNPGESFLGILRQEYRRATERLSTAAEMKSSGMWSPANRLGNHLLTYYGWGILDFGEDDGLFDAFFESAPVTVRSDVMQWVGRLKWSDDTDLEDGNRALDRFRALMERRITFFERSDKARDDAGELESFGSWVMSPYFDEDWCLDQLERILRKVGRVQQDSMVLQHFETVVHTKPHQVLQCVQLMVELGKDELGPARWHPRIRKILEGARNSSGPEVSDEVRRLINRMSTRGIGGFDDLLD